MKYAIASHCPILQFETTLTQSHANLNMSNQIPFTRI